jgi:hypothetical protein
MEEEKDDFVEVGEEKKQRAKVPKPKIDNSAPAGVKPPANSAGEKSGDKTKNTAPKKDAAKPVKKAPEAKADVRGSGKEFLETDIDKLYELARDKGILKVKDASKALGIEVDRIEEWGRILEEHKLVRLRYPPVGDPVLILKRFITDKEKIKSLKKGKKLRPKKRIFLINLVVLLAFAALVAFYTVRFQTIRITYSQAYLAAAAIIIIGLVLIFRLVRKRVKHEKNTGEKGDKGSEAGAKKGKGGNKKAK